MKKFRMFCFLLVMVLCVSCKARSGGVASDPDTEEAPDVASSNHMRGDAMSLDPIAKTPTSPSPALTPTKPVVTTPVAPAPEVEPVAAEGPKPSAGGLSVKVGGVEVTGGVTMLAVPIGPADGAAFDLMLYANSNVDFSCPSGVERPEREREALMSTRLYHASVNLEAQFGPAGSLQWRLGRRSFDGDNQAGRVGVLNDVALDEESVSGTLEAIEFVGTRFHKGEKISMAGSFRAKRCPRLSTAEGGKEAASTLSASYQGHVIELKGAVRAKTGELHLAEHPLSCADLPFVHDTVALRIGFTETGALRNLRVGGTRFTQTTSAKPGEAFAATLDKNGETTASLSGSARLGDADALEFNGGSVSFIDCGSASAL